MPDICRGGCENSCPNSRKYFCATHSITLCQKCTNFLHPSCDTHSLSDLESVAEDIDYADKTVNRMLTYGTQYGLERQINNYKEHTTIFTTALDKIKKQAEELTDSNDVPKYFHLKKKVRE
jgi:hypothetical protein